MNAPTWWRLVCAGGIAFGLGLAGPSRADDKGPKDPGKDKNDKTVMVIQLDLSKAPPGLVKQLVALSKGTDKDDGGPKKVAKKGGDDDPKKVTKKVADKKEVVKKGGDDPKKGDDKKAKVIQVDVSKLSPDLAKRLMAELAKGKGKDDGGPKKDAKKGDDDRKEGGKKGEAKDKDDDEKGGKKKD